ncbi:MAG: hypothetical protein J0J04_08040 [Microbacterium sp.]|uniref:hypothetical protein n=1 Tax=Microbacterium sp. TaxID=51671 RepID=UPI001ACCFA66|nr:hypothetical protein [Microbacterium sp.]MBN9214750.1 hypothetical protein [Microbacterium sp.]
MNTAKRASRSSRVSLADVLDLFGAATDATVTSVTRDGAPVRGSQSSSRKVLAVDGARVVLAGLVTGSRSTLDLARMEGATVSAAGELRIYLPGNVTMRVQLEHRRGPAIAKAA